VNDIDVMKKTAQLMHEELFELIQTLSDSSTNSNGSSAGEQFTTGTSNSLGVRFIRAGMNRKIGKSLVV
jgi:hypothetical protein